MLGIFQNIPYSGYHYKAITQKLTWHAAQRRCRHMGGNLATVTSSHVNNMIVNMMGRL